MSDPLQMWSDRQANAHTPEARRALLAELAVWRARNLTNVSATRRATYTIARLHQQIGDHDKAVGEAKTLMSLCRTPPEAADEEIAAVSGLLKALGISAEAPTHVNGAQRRDRRGRRDQRERRAAGERRAPGERPAKTGRPGSVEAARRAANAGDWAGVMSATDGAKGAGATVLRAYAQLAVALAAPEAERAAKLDALRDLLARGAGLRTPSQSVAPGDDPLSVLLGEPVPTRRGPRLRMMDAFAEANPDRLDELAEAALKHHVLTSGKPVPAPWLVGVVGRALALTEAERTKAAIAELRNSNAVAVAAYDELPFHRLQRVTKRAAALGHGIGSLRRGVLAREEPDDRKLWTLRLTIDGIERMLTVGPHATAPYPPGKSEMLAARLVALCSRTLLLATGSGNEELRERAQAMGISVLAQDADDDAVIAALAEAGPAASPDAPGAPPPERLQQALQAETFDAEAIRSAVADFRRPDRALRPIMRLDIDDERTATLLGAVHEAAGPDVVIPEGTTMAVRAAAHGAATRALLVDSPASGRFGGPGVAQVVDLAKVVLDDGWFVHRVLRGPTRREGRIQPAVQTLAPSLGGLWRLLVRRGEQRGEVWYVAELPAEGRAAVPLLLLEEHARTVALADDEELATWWSTVAGAPSAVRWTGAEAETLKTAMGAFEASAPVPEAPAATPDPAPAEVAESAPTVDAPEAPSETPDASADVQPAQSPEAPPSPTDLA
ncbi:MAG: hypothetical protein KTR31_37535 [Myxococcales bacterium]|nr:hypothetical protein [Myxococcales bacterium]